MESDSWHSCPRLKRARAVSLVESDWASRSPAWLDVPVRSSKSHSVYADGLWGGKGASTWTHRAQEHADYDPVRLHL
ncbi:hypothetical protein HJFPF1_01998 [Paramyrothecium foliicola]|nr:hypothetical protein HJFPF1_01998 [Paramyrothecium foliicola]